LVETSKIEKNIDREKVVKLLGVTKYEAEQGLKEDSVGVANGLAWTVMGGEVMPIEAQIASGKGELTLTGHLGNVMQESAKAAMFYARANAMTLGIDPDFYQHTDIHIHVPHGATPKDGPSAGVTIVTALVSALCDRKVSKGIAMTGEITLRGQVLGVGGIKEKALAAIRFGIKKIIIPAENIKDLEEIPKAQRDKVHFITVSSIDEVLEHALI
jgi:ATP-dependent Lon protease